MNTTTDRKKIILVDDNTTNLTTYLQALHPYYEVYPATSADMMIEMSKRVFPDMVMLDLEARPNLNDYRTIGILKNSAALKEVPLLFLVTEHDERNLIDLNTDCTSHAVKPLSDQQLLGQIETHLSAIARKKEQKERNSAILNMLTTKAGQNTRLHSMILNIMTDFLECLEDATSGHVSRTQRYLACMIRRLTEADIYSSEISLWNLDQVSPSAQLHDVGKIGISTEILDKPGRLTPEEFEIMKTHVEIGVDAINFLAQTVSDSEFFEHAKIFAGTHHERWDGTGYPHGLRGLTIPLEGRLMAIVDVYDALISARSYKKALPASQAADYINKKSGKDFDPQLVDIFNTVSDQFEDIAREFC